MKIHERLGWKAEWRIDKFLDPTDEIAKALQNGLSMTEALHRFKESFLGSEEWQNNVGLNEGLQELIDIICGLGTPVKWDNTNAFLGVGDSNAAESPSHTGLQASTNKLYKAMDTSYPSRSGQTAEWRSTYGSSDANFAWEEYSVSNTNSDTGKNLNRKIASKGTKASGETWTLSLKITWS